MLQKPISQCNIDSGFNIQLCLNKTSAFTGMMAHYGKFHNVKNYIALVGKNDNALEELCRYYGEKIVLRAQCLDLNTYWVASSFNKRKSRTAFQINSAEMLLMLIALGYGATSGVAHKSKSIKKLSTVHDTIPKFGFLCACRPWYHQISF
ncbi:MAG: nitroreductase family protein [Breznakia sp.]